MLFTVRKPQCLIMKIIVHLCIILPILFVHSEAYSVILSDQTLNNPHYIHLLYTRTVLKSLHEMSKASRNFLEGPSIYRILDGFYGASCRNFLPMAVDNVKTSLPAMTGALMSCEDRGDFRTRLSAAITQVRMCIDTLPGGARGIAASHFHKSVQLMNTGLSILSQIDEAYEDLEEDDEEETGKLLSPYMSDGVKHQGKPKPNVVVAADGSGNYKSISEAIKAAPSNSNTRFVIYVKAGVYKENVVIPYDKTNIMMYGDGMRVTIVTSNRSTKHPDGLQTPDIATFYVMGKGFIGMDMTFQNTAGPKGGQAVALLSGSDQSAVYRCRIDSYQDSLWAAFNRQFYRECEILGTIDFIFGNAAVVIQSSTISVKRPLAGQYNTITAQGKENTQFNTGTVIQDCNIGAAEDLGRTQTYLGRPWRPFSTTIVMTSTLGGFIDPKGWSSFDGQVPNTLYYAEYENKGPGASTSQRVAWNGYKKNISPSEARKFTVKSFIYGDRWLPATSVPFKLDL